MKKTGRNVVWGRKGQSGVEYLIVLAIALILTVVAVGMLTGFIKTGTNTQYQKKSQAYWRSADIGILDWEIYNSSASNFVLQNNLHYQINIVSMTLTASPSQTITLNRRLVPGDTYTFNTTDIHCTGDTYSYTVKFIYDNTDMKLNNKRFTGTEKLTGKCHRETATTTSSVTTTTFTGDAEMLLEAQSGGDSGTGNDYSSSVYADDSGNVYVGGYTGGDLDFGNNITLTNIAGNDFFVVKYDSSGTAQWIGTSQSGGDSGTGNDAVQSVYVDDSGNIYATGDANNDIDFGNGVILTNLGGWDFFVVKYNSAGTAQWVGQAQAGGDSGTGNEIGTSVYVDGSGNVYATGYTYNDIDFGNGVTLTNIASYDFFIVKYNSAGTAQWVATAQAGGDSGTGTERTSAVYGDDSGNIYLSGYTDGDIDFGNGVTLTNKGDNDFFVVKYNSAGTAQWIRTAESGGDSGTGSDTADSLYLDTSGNIYVTGSASDDIDFGNSITLNNIAGSDIYVVKYDSSGTAQWIGQAQPGGDSGTGWDSVESVYVDTSGNIYITGHSSGDIDFGNSQTLTNINHYDFYVVKYDSSGTAQWIGKTQSGGDSGTGMDHSDSVCVDTSGNIYITGETNNDLDFGNGQTLTNKGGYDFFLVKYS
jgi:hypothetical protein